jgi:integrase/recombinase XerD
MTADRNPRKGNGHQYRSLPIQEWPEGDRKAWEEACRSGVRLQPGGRASHFAEASLKDFVCRYGAYLGFLQRTGVFNLKSRAAAQVTRSNVRAYVAELKARVSSVTTWNCIYKLRRAAQLLNPKIDFSWLLDVERESALVMTPRSKFDRLVLTTRLVEAGLTLIAEAEE